MTGMENLQFDFPGGPPQPAFAPVIVGVVASGNLEVLVEPSTAAGCVFHIETSARGFGRIWEAVVRDFHTRHGLSGATVSIHDMGATPAVVSLRLDQAAQGLAGIAP